MQIAAAVLLLMFLTLIVQLHMCGACIDWRFNTASDPTRPASRHQIDMTNFKQYLARIGSDLKAGNATEHTHRPALQMLIEGLADVKATNEPKRIACGAPDYIVSRDAPAGLVPIGYIEAKDVNKDLNVVELDEQLNRYRSSLRNLVLTDYLEFRLYRNGELVQTGIPLK